MELQRKPRKMSFVFFFIILKPMTLDLLKSFPLK